MKLYSVKMRASLKGQHISGAERIVNEAKVKEVASSLVERALKHSRGKPDFINIKVELIKEEIKKIPLLPVFEIKGSYSPLAIIKEIAGLSGVSPELAEKVYKLLLSGPAPDGSVMRGAMVVRIPDGERVEPDKFKGIRATLLDIEERVVDKLKETLKEKYTENFKEALVLTSKILSFSGVLGELCISDDPNYTTGYFSVKGVGYFRIFNIKKKGVSKGGRAIFVSKECKLDEFFSFLTSKPIIADEFFGYSVISTEEIPSLFIRNSPV